MAYPKPRGLRSWQRRCDITIQQESENSYPHTARLPTFINGNADGMLIEACAGLLDKEQPEEAIKRETEEETGYKVTEVKKIFEAYMCLIEFVGR